MKTFIGTTCLLVASGCGGSLASTWEFDLPVTTEAPGAPVEAKVLHFTTRVEDGATPGTFEFTLGPCRFTAGQTSAGTGRAHPNQTCTFNPGESFPVVGGAAEGGETLSLGVAVFTVGSDDLLTIRLEHEVRTPDRQLRQSFVGDLKRGRRAR